MERRWRGAAPSNIALIKYMGKTEQQGNRPTNSSLSYTLEHLRTHVELELLSQTDGEDRWEPLTGEGLTEIHLSQKGRERFLKHLGRVKEAWNFNGSFLVRSANDFPSDCGLASSASSFAALTKVAALALNELCEIKIDDRRRLADLSRQGSGSSCRSFFSPWSLWSATGADSVELPFHDLIHQVVIVEDARKAVSSSEAHVRVASSLLFEGRPQRAEQRLQSLLETLKSRDWKEAMEICWAEFWDMHALFETARPSFGYMTPASLEVVNFAKELWLETGDGPLVTMDAGANVHLLYRPECGQLAGRVRGHFDTRYQVISSTDRRNLE